MYRQGEFTSAMEPFEFEAEPSERRRTRGVGRYGRSGWNPEPSVAFAEFYPAWAGHDFAFEGETTTAAVPWDQHGFAYVQWLQSALNQVLKLKLATNGRPDSRTISAIQRLQRKSSNRLARIGLVGPWTDQLLVKAGAPALPVFAPTTTVGLDCDWDTRPYLSCIQKATFRGLPISFVARYYSGSPRKDLSRGEAEALSKLGIRCVTVWERFAKEATGRDNGRNHGYKAFKLAIQCGQPTGAPIYFAVDYEPSRAVLRLLRQSRSARRSARVAHSHSSASPAIKL